MEQAARWGRTLPPEWDGVAAVHGLGLQRNDARIKALQLCASVAVKAAAIALNDAVKRLHELMDDTASSQHEIGTLYNNIIDNRLAEKAGYRYARELFAKEFKDVAQSTLSLYGVVARHFDDASAKSYGVACLGRLITYCSVAGINLPGGDPGALKIKVPQKDGTVVEKSFADCSRNDMVRALKLFSEPPQPLPATDTETMDKLHDALRAALGQGSRIELKAAYGGDKTKVSLTNVDLEELPSVVAALQSVLPPPPAPEEGQSVRLPRRSLKRR